jgi:hypothetical protein
MQRLRATQEGSGFRKHGVRLIAMRRVLAIRKLHSSELTRSDAVRDAFDLLERPIFVVEPLDREHRTGDLRKQRFDVPLSESRIEPDVVPTPEGAFDVLVAPSELGARRVSAMLSKP